MQRRGGGRGLDLCQGRRWSGRSRVMEVTGDKVTEVEHGKDWTLALSEMGSQR